MFRKGLIFCIFFQIAYVLGCSMAYGQQYSWKYYSVADGLPQTQIICLYQDSKGYIWIGTKGGLSKFDGIDFENFTSRDGLDFDYVNQIQEDKNKALYIGTTAGINTMKNGKIGSIPLEPDSYHPFQYLDQNNLLWIYTQKQGLICYKDTQKIEDHPLNNFVNSNEQIIVYGYNTKCGKLLFKTLNSGFQSWDGVIITEVKEHSSVTSALFSDTGELFGFSEDSIFIDNNGQFEPYLYTKGLSILAINSPKDIYFRDEANLTYLYHFDGEKIARFNQKFNVITCVMVDDEDNLWVGTESGLWRLMSKGFQNYLEVPNENFYTWTVMQDKNDQYWFGSFQNGLKKFDGIQFININVEPLFQPHGFQYFYSGGIKDKNDDLLFSTWKGVLKFDGKGFSWLVKEKLGTILYIYEDRPNDLLYLASAKDGLVEIDQQRNVRYFHDRESLEHTGLVTSIVKDKYNRIWISGKNGISIRQDDKWRNLPDNSDSLSIGAISMIKDFKGNLWFGSNSGLYFYDYKKLRQVATDIITQQVGVLNFAKSGELLLGSIKGIGLLDLERFYTLDDETIRYFDSQNGFLGTECKHNSSFNDNQGDTWICTSDRVVKVNTDELKTNPNPPRTYIKSISTLSERMEWIPKLNVYSHDEQYEFDPSHDDLRFNYHGISHSAPNGVKYQTMLEGYDHNWSAITAERYRTYTNLPHGYYTFMVKSANIDGVWTDDIPSVQLYIKPAWHELQIVRYGGILAIVVFAAGIGYLYAEQKRKRKVIEDQNERKLAKLQFKSLQGLIDPHFTFNAINSIASMVYKENRDEAYIYFTKFSRLIRTAFDNSSQTTRTIKDEISFVTNYLDIEKMRFKDRFDYKIEIDRNINYDWKIPKMIIQIYVENAIKHGLIHKLEGGELKIFLGIKNENLLIIIRDNGVGRSISKMVKDQSASLGKGTHIMKEYFELLNKFNEAKISSETIDLFDEKGGPGGTQVTVSIPFNFKYTL